MAHERAVSMVGLESLAIGIEMKGNDAWQNENDRGQDLEHPGDENAFLTFPEGAGSEGALNDLLIGRPVKKV